MSDFDDGDGLELSPKSAQSDDLRTGECICGHPHHSHPLPGRMPGVHCERCYRCTGWRRIDTTFDNGRHNG